MEIVAIVATVIAVIATATMPMDRLRAAICAVTAVTATTIAATTKRALATTAVRVAAGQLGMAAKVSVHRVEQHVIDAIFAARVVAPPFQVDVRGSVLVTIAMAAAQVAVKPALVLLSALNHAATASMGACRVCLDVFASAQEYSWVK